MNTRKFFIVMLAAALFGGVIVVYHFGNAFTGLQAASLGPECSIRVGQRRLNHARTFSEVPQGEAFWYENSCGLVELAVNGGHAAEALGLQLGAAVLVESAL